MIPALMVIDGEETEANACEVDDGSVQVRAESGTTVVVDGGATDPSMTLSDESGGVEALSVEFEAVADDADRYIGTFDPELTGDIGSITVEYNVGLLLCSDD